MIYRGMVTGAGDVFQLALEGNAGRYLIINIGILGILFGLSDFLGTFQTNPDILPLTGKFAIFTPLIFSTAGIVTICVALIACTLLYWAAAIAFGGQGGLGLVFNLVGMASVPFWVLAPLLNYTLRYTSPQSSTAVLLYFLIIPAFLWSFKVVRQSIITGQKLSPGRATIAVCGMWIFSISAVYVFIP